MGDRKGEMSIITVTFSVLFLMVIIVMIWYVVLPWIHFSFIDVCWGQFASDTGDMSAGIYRYGYRNVTLDFGECATGLFFLNKNSTEELRDITDEVQLQIKNNYDRDIPLTEIIFDECNEDGEAFIIAVPWFGDTLDLGGPIWWILGGAALGAWTGGGAPVIGNVKVKGTPILSIIGALYGGVSGEQLRQIIRDRFAAIEERGKKGICFSLSMPFEQDFYVVPKTDDLINDFTGKYEPYDGKYCVMLFKGKEAYYVNSWNETCFDNRDAVLGEIEALKEAEKG